MTFKQNFAAHHIADFEEESRHVQHQKIAESKKRAKTKNEFMDECGLEDLDEVMLYSRYLK